MRTAVKIEQNPLTGEQTRTSYIGNTGNASMKVRKIEKKLPNENDWQMILSKIYNENGNIIREIDGSGNLKEFVYDKEGRHWKTLRNGILSFMAYNKNSRDDLMAYENVVGEGYTFKMIKKNKHEANMVIEKNGVEENVITFNTNKNIIDFNGIELSIKITK